MLDAPETMRLSSRMRVSGLAGPRPDLNDARAAAHLTWRRPRAPLSRNQPGRL